MLCINRRNCE